MVKSSNLQLIIKLRKAAKEIGKIEQTAGEMLVKNIRIEADKVFKKGEGTKYPYEFHNSFQQDDMVYYDDARKKVVLAHPAAARLEFGFGSIDITPKKGKALKFTGAEGETVVTNKVHVRATKPLGYARRAIKITEKELAEKFSEVIK